MSFRDRPYLVTGNHAPRRFGSLESAVRFVRGIKPGRQPKHLVVLFSPVNLRPLLPPDEPAHRVVFERVIEKSRVQ